MTLIRRHIFFDHRKYSFFFGMVFNDVITVHSLRFRRSIITFYLVFCIRDTLDKCKETNVVEIFVFLKDLDDKFRIENFGLCRSVGLS